MRVESDRAIENRQQVIVERDKAIIANLNFPFYWAKVLKIKLRHCHILPSHNRSQ